MADRVMGQTILESRRAAKPVAYRLLEEVSEHSSRDGVIGNVLIRGDDLAS